jgi:ABC-type polysaccharide/polyol phosphate transport system ATPase subunit
MTSSAQASTASPAIEARDVRKSFRIPHERQTTLKERALHPLRWLRGGDRQLEALRGISFDVGQGEFFGVIGRNGCGKSTLMKLLASIYQLDGGSIRVKGRLAPFIELGVGFNPELPALDNVVMNGVMMGLSPREARRRFESVIDYAELGDFTDLKLKNYSSGMQVRLAFSLMLEADADVLLVDEVLSVGDVAFQEKCIASLTAMKDRGTTIVLVSHDMDAVQRHCDRAMLIENGLVDTAGEPGAVAARYLEVVFTPVVEGNPVEERPDRGASVTSAWLSNGAGEVVERVPEGEPLTVNFSIHARERFERLRIHLELVKNPEGVIVATFPVGYEGEIPPIEAGEEATVSVHLENGGLGSGSYRFNYILGILGRPLDRASRPIPLTVTGASSEAGLVRMGHRTTVEGGAVESPK